ncbi:MAG TPA: alanine racemase [Nocardioidaceae bacterium]|nr:alanine racemase [Nocardioidaceae bacterium]
MLRMYVDGERWRAHLRKVAETRPGIVPVAKGNGYGFGIPRLARKAGWLGVDTMAVGTYGEVADVASRFAGSILVLTPWRPGESAELDGRTRDRVVHTVGRLEDLEALAAAPDKPRVVLERLTSMKRHGFSAAGLREAGGLLADHARVHVEGVAFHLPLASTSHLAEVERLMTDVVAAGLRTRTVYVSHLTADELATLASSYPDFDFRPRIGTELWLGDPDALRVRATVLDTHPVERGERYGYRGRRAPRPGTLVVVSGGTSHGIGLESPAGELSLRTRAATLARGGLDAAGLVRSPYVIDGKHRLFAEPPHMQASMLFLPSGSRVPEIGEQVPMRVRHTATAFDEVLLV